MHPRQNGYILTVALADNPSNMSYPNQIPTRNSRFNPNPIVLPLTVLLDDDRASYDIEPTTCSILTIALEDNPFHLSYSKHVTTLIIIIPLTVLLDDDRASYDLEFLHAADSGRDADGYAALLENLRDAARCDLAFTRYCYDQY